MNDDQIERLLRKAPETRAPDDLLERLKSDIALPQPMAGRQNRTDSLPWFRRWLPALGLAGCLLACVAVFAVQSGSLRQLHEENETLRKAPRNIGQLQQQNLEYQRLTAEHRELERLRKDHQELQQLRDEVVRLRAQLQEIARLQSENQMLRAGTTALRPADKDADFFARVPDAQSKSERIQCVNNLKQIGLAARLWGTDNGDILPSDFAALSSYLGTPKILHCPGDSTRPEAATWAEFSPANLSYEMLSPGVAETDPQMVYVRCPIHNNVGMVDGSVQQLGRNRKLILRDGKYYIDELNAPGDDASRQRSGLPTTDNPAGNGVPATKSAEDIVRERYGLPPVPKQ
ncbi:MAG TPA: hypothetical protein VLU94_01255 [Candidatus Nitrosotalea sp.]|nr:hypothetical protein [Candidatus Nitrosotalea sp.]